jgi:hypothetical protein
MHFEDHSLLFHYQETMYLVILDMHTFMQSVTDVKDVWLSMLLPGAFTVHVTTPHWGYLLLHTEITVSVLEFITYVCACKIKTSTIGLFYFIHNTSCYFPKENGLRNAK